MPLHIKYIQNGIRRQEIEYQMKKAANLLLYRLNGFSLVAGVHEISNFELMTRLKELIDFLENY